MEKETVVHLTNTSIKVIQGSSNASHMIKVESFKEYALLEGTMLNGVVMDEEGMKEVLQTIFKKGIRSTRLVIDSGQILRKHAIVPKLKHQEIIQLCKDELNTVEGDYEDLVYDYTILQESLENQDGMEILCCAIDKKFLKSYIDLFQQANITILSIDIAGNALHKLTSILPELKEKTYAVSVIDGNDVSNSLFVNNHLVFTNRARLFSDRGSVAFVTELTTSITQLSQFNKSQYKDTTIEIVYFCGLDTYEENMIYDVVKNTLDMEAGRFVNTRNVSSVNSVSPFELHKYVYAVGSLIRK